MAIQALAARSPPTPLLSKFTNRVGKAKTPKEFYDVIDTVVAQYRQYVEN